MFVQGKDEGNACTLLGILKQLKMKGEFLLKDDFENWLTKTVELSPEAAKSYISYVRGADKLISVSKKGSSEKFSLFTILQEEFGKQNIEIIEETLRFVIDELSRKNAEEFFNKPKKTLQNYKSGLNRYLNFLSEQSFSFENVNAEKIETPENQIENFDIFTDTEELLSNNEVVKVYSKNDLIKNFSLRIKTQDRFYEKIFFPIRFINRVFSIQNKRSIFNKWLNSLLDSITIFLKDEKTTFKEITSLTIENDEVFINHKKQEKLAYTKQANNTKIVPFSLSTLNKIAIDHDPSLFKVMNDNLKKLPTIRDITEELKKHIIGNVTYSKLSKASHSNSNNLNDFIGTINTNDLLAELELISSKTNLQLMDSSQNTSKGKKLLKTPRNRYFAKLGGSCCLAILCCKIGKKKNANRRKQL